MSQVYEEIIHGETLLRAAPGKRHEKICEALHARILAGLNAQSASRALSSRSIVQLAPGSLVRPDLALVTSATGKLWLAAEIVDSQDHRPDTVLKKGIYEEFKLPRLWMIDPRYDNIEVYHNTPYGLALKGILAGRERLLDSLLPDFDVTVAEIFAA